MPTETDPTAATATAVCWPVLWGDVKRDHRQRYKCHDFIPQPFYNQDSRVWCQRCGLLTKPVSNDCG